MRHLIAVFLVALIPFISTAADPKIGDRVFYKPGAKATVDGMRVDIRTILFPATVGDVKDESLWLGRGWVSKNDVMTIDEALKFFDEQIQEMPTNPRWWKTRGAAWREKGDFDKSIKDLTEAIRLDPKNATTYSNRGSTWAFKGEFDNAISDHTEAIKLSPKIPFLYNNRAYTWQLKGDFDKAIEDYGEAIRIDPNYLPAYNGISWLRATCPNDKYCDAKEALECGMKACDLTDWKSSADLDTVSAAYAESGDFKNAIKWQEKAVELAPENERQGYTERLELYRMNKPYRQTPKK